MAFTPILSNQSISYASSRSEYRNSARETLAGGTPVFFSPSYATLNDYGYGGPKYRYGYTYYNSGVNIYGNCTWWCWSRLYETMGTGLPNYGDGKYWYDSYSGAKDRNADNIRAGDIIVFTQPFSGESVTAKVVKLHKFDSFEELYKSLPLLKCGYTEENIDKANYTDMNMYYSFEEQKKYGVVGIEICLI